MDHYSKPNLPSIAYVVDVDGKTVKRMTLQERIDYGKVVKEGGHISENSNDKDQTEPISIDQSVESDRKRSEESKTLQSDELFSD
jgi:hypothetical protein